MNHVPSYLDPLGHNLEESDLVELEKRQSKNVPDDLIVPDRKEDNEPEPVHDNFIEVGHAIHDTIHDESYKETFSCEICQREFPSEIDIVTHLNTEH